MATKPATKPARSENFFKKIDELYFQLQQRYGHRLVDDYLNCEKETGDQTTYSFDYKVGEDIIHVELNKHSNMDAEGDQPNTYSYDIKVTTPTKSFFMEDHWHTTFAQLNKVLKGELVKWKDQLKVAKKA